MKATAVNGIWISKNGNILARGGGVEPGVSLDSVCLTNGFMSIKKFHFHLDCKA